MAINFPAAPALNDVYLTYKWDGAKWVALPPASYVVKTSSTGSALMPAGTTAQRDGIPVFGATRANSTTTEMEWWNGSAWVPMGGGGGLTFAAAAPTIPHINPFWWDSTNGALYVQYTDVDSTQWVSASANIVADLSLKADIASPTFTGVPAVPTAAADTNTTQAASTAFVIGQSTTTATPVMNGAAAVGTSLKLSKIDHVHPSDTSKADLAGNVAQAFSMATAAADTNTTQGATTAFVIGQSTTTSTPLMNGAAAVGTSLKLSKIDHVHPSDTTKSSVGKQTVWIPAGAMTPRTTFPAAAGSVETTNNKVMLKTLDFDQASNEFAQFAIQMPKSWNESTVTAKFLWKHAAATSYAVVWGIQAVALSDNEGADATAFGTAVTAIDTGGTTNNIYSSAETSAMTIAGSPAVQDWVVFQVYRDAADTGNDTLNQDAGLIGIQLFYTTDGVNDA